MRNNVYKIIILAFVLTSCGGTKKTAVHDTRYQRQPIVEVTQEQLEIESMMLDAKLQEEIGNRQEALARYNQIIAKTPAMAAAYYEKARLLQSQNRSDSAVHYFQKAVQLDGDNLWYKILLANLYDQRQDGENLVKTWSAIVKQCPDKLDYYYELSNAYILANDIPAAVATLNKVEKIVGITESISLQKQKLWEFAGKSDKALKEVEALADALPQEYKYSAILAEANMRAKNYPKAKQYYDRVLAANPDDDYIHISLASYYKAVGDMASAAAELKKGFLNPAIDAKSKLQILGSFYTNEEFYGSQSKYTFGLLEIIMQQTDDSTTYALFYGDVLMRQNKYAEAARQFQLHLATDSSQYEVWEALLICLHSADSNLDALLEYSQRASALFPLHQLPYYMQAYVQFMNKNYEESLKHALRCEKIGFRKGYLESECYAIIADSYHALNQHNQCYAYYDKYLVLHPDDVFILNNYAYYLAEDNMRLEEAERMSRRTIEADPNEATFLDTYGWVLHKMGRDTEAIKYIQKALSLKNDDDYRNHLNELLKP